MSSIVNKNIEKNLTIRAFYASCLFNECLFYACALLPFILVKDLGASSMHIELLIIMRPLLGLISPYWSFGVNNKQSKLVPNVLWANFLSKLPFIFLPFTDNIWIILAMVFVFWVFYRGSMPAWMEILKLHMDGKERAKVFSRSFLTSNVLCIVLAFTFAPIMQAYPGSWKVLFSVSAFLGFSTLYFQAKLPLNLKVYSPETKDSVVPTSRVTWIENIKKPWQASLRLLWKRKDFSKFQLGFLLGGGSVMMMKPAEIMLAKLPQLSYYDINHAVGMCKSLGILLTLNLWKKSVGEHNLFKLCSIILCLTALCYVFFLLTPYQIVFFFVAYFIYGIWQAGSHLVWHLSGPAFSRQADSSLFSTVNVFMVGLRGIFMPFLGARLLIYFGQSFVFSMGITLCFVGSILMYNYRYLWGRQQQEVA